jgi:hypothetical protein
VVVIAVPLATATWIGVRAFEAKSHLEAAQGEIGQLKKQALSLDIVSATATLESIKGHTGNAIKLTDDPIWRTGELLPAIGANLTAVRELASATDDIVLDVATPLIEVAGNVDPASLAPKDGAINIQPLIDAIPAVHHANGGLKRAIVAVDQIDTDKTIAQISAAKHKVSGMLATLAPALDSLGRIVPLIPPAMGSEGPRTYVVMFQNPAEARALGGTALSFAVVKVDQGRIDLSETVAAGFDNFTHHASSVIPIPDGAETVYPKDSFGTFIPNATLRPSFTTAAAITQEMWRQQFGYTVDGILSIDPVALSYILRATEPITLSSGDVLTSTSLVPFLLNTVYLRFNSGDAVADNLAQDQIYGEAVSATFSRLASGSLNPKVLVAALLQGWDERRVLYWSAQRDEQAQLAAIGLNGELPLSDAKTDRVGIYFQDNVGSKLNYYLQQSVHLGTASCRSDGRQNYRVSVDLGSVVPPDPALLPPAVVGAWEREGLRPGVQRMIIMLYAPPGSEIVSASVNGQPVIVESMRDTTYPVGKMTVSVEPGATLTMSYDVVAAEPGKKALEAQVTPLVNPTFQDERALDCATVPQE